MTDVQELVREALRRHEAEVPMPDPLDVHSVTARARRRQVLNVVGVGVMSVMIAVGAATGIAALLRADVPRPAILPTPVPSPTVQTTLPQLRRNGEIITHSRGNLVAVDPDTGHSRTILGRGEIRGTIGSAAWSYDGKWLAYDIVGCSPRAGLWVQSARGGPRRLTTWDCRSSFAEPWAWSPSEAQLGTMRASTGGHALTLLDPSTGRETDLGDVVGDASNLINLAWAPDGNRIAYGTVRGGTVYSVDVESGDHSLLVRLPGYTGSIDGIDWSPDGTHLAIVGGGLYIANADGSGLHVADRDVARGYPASHPDPSPMTAWSPDGTRLAYANFSGPRDRQLRIWTVALDSSAPSLVVSHTNPVCCQSGGTPAWSPDGSHIAFAVPLDPRETRTGYLVINADGTGDATRIDELTYLRLRGGWYFCGCFG
jgi:WD40 repeat protein